LEAQVSLLAPEKTYPVLAKHAAQLRYLFIVSDVMLGKVDGGAESIAVKITHADGQKCERCWNYSTHVGEDPAHPSVCERCAAVLKEIGSH
jgi:isoleucyl-tRNA synthetase